MPLRVFTGRKLASGWEPVLERSTFDVGYDIPTAIQSLGEIPLRGLTHHVGRSVLQDVSSGTGRGKKEQK